MTQDAQSWRIKQLEEELRSIKAEVQSLRSLRDQLIGMSTAARWGLRFLILIGGTGAVDLVARVIHWLNAPMAARGLH